jgi:hypothetical protein
VSVGVEGKLTEDQVEKLRVGDRISQRALTGTVHTIGPELIGIKWDGKDWSEVYTPAEMARFSLHVRRRLQ